MVTRINIAALPEDLQEFARELLASGEVSSESDLLRQAFAALRRQRREIEELRSEIDSGLASPLLDGEETMAALRERSLHR